MNSPIKIFSFGAALWVIAACAQAAEFHVSISGNDTNSGTAVAPFCTIQRTPTSGD
jgi:hypothetical protein